ncbi:MAG: amidohydrolase family protein [Anaerolineae bacterium]|nr:amidohydrolase family protein [Anaerolineae bacterium]
MKKQPDVTIKHLFKAVALLLLVLFVGTAQPSSPALAQTPQTTAFVNVNVIPMDTERVLENQTVIVEGDRITAIGPVGDVAIPDGVEIIEGNGAYLMPGLADMHTHLHHDPDPDFMRLYLDQGVTTVRNLNALPEHLEWREQVANGVLLGPTIYTSGPEIVGVPPEFRWLKYTFWAILILSPVVIGLLVWLIIWLLAKYTTLIANFGQMRRFILPSLAGLLLVGLLLVWSKVIPLNVYTSRIYPEAAVPETAGQARQLVRDQQAAGVDFIKPYDFLTREQYFAAMDEAEKLGIYAAGHIPDQPEVVSVREMIEAGQDEVAHVDEFTHEFWVDYDPVASEQGWVEYEIDMSLIDEVAAMVAENDVEVTLTLVTNEIVLLGLEDMEGLLQRPEYRVIRPEVMEAWRTGGRFVNWKGQEKYRREQWRPLLMQLTKALHEHGALLALGTDVNVQGVVPGLSVHQELGLLVEAGLTPFEALATGTRNAAQITGRMGADSAWGTIEVGKRADLILLPGNPLEDVSHTQDRLGVMVRGQWFTQAELDALLDEFVATYQADVPLASQ